MMWLQELELYLNSAEICPSFCMCSNPIFTHVIIVFFNWCYTLEYSLRIFLSYDSAQFIVACVMSTKFQNQGNCAITDHWQSCRFCFFFICSVHIQSNMCSVQNEFTTFKMHLLNSEYIHFL